jgi:hypothetical protein
VPGAFKESLPPFLRQYDKIKRPGHRDVSFIHIDCETYTATREVLTLLEHRIASGAVIVFDELFNYRYFRCASYRLSPMRDSMTSFIVIKLYKAILC